MTSVDARQFLCKVTGKHGRVEWVAECRCASMGFGHDRQGYKCLDCGEWFGSQHPADLNSAQVVVGSPEKPGNHNLTGGTPSDHVVPKEAK